MARHAARHKRAQNSKQAEPAFAAPLAAKAPEKPKSPVKSHRPRKRHPILGIGTSLLCLLFAVGFGVYATAIAGFSDFVNEYRDLWIETAMTSTNHRWLATAFFPKDIIDSVMGQAMEDDGSTPTEKKFVEPPKDPDVLGLKLQKVGDKDYAGYEILYNDIAQGLFISNVTGSGYVGKAAVIDDPDRLFLETTAFKEEMGEKVLSYMDKYDAILGVNASPYRNPKWRGTGGQILGKALTARGSWGSFRSNYATIGFTEDNQLFIGKIPEKEWAERRLRDAMQFGPVLMVDNDVKIHGSGGWGIAPRTVIGQRPDGVVVLLEVDGRHPGYSLGAKLSDCVEVMKKYGVVNAAACDGGSSSVMAYNGKVLTRPTSTTDGRRLPDAWLVRRNKMTPSTTASSAAAAAATAASH